MAGEPRITHVQDKAEGETLRLLTVIRNAGPLVLVGTAYVVLAVGGLQLAALNQSVTPIWPPTGLAIAAVLLCGYRIAPAIFAAAFIVNQLTLPSIPTSTIIASGNTLEAVLAGFLIRYWAEGTQAFSRPANVIKFFFVCILATALGATIGVSGLTLTSDATTDLFVALWLTWWMGDLAGAIVVAPCLILWTRDQPHGPDELQATTITYVAAAAIGFVCLSPVFFQTPIRYALSYLVIGPLLWAALKRGPRDTATIVLIISCFAVWGSTSAYAHPVSDPHRITNYFILLLAFILGVSMPSLVLAAQVRTKSDDEKIHAQQALEAHILWQASNRAASAGSLEDFLSDCLEQICKVANWQIGHIYLPDRIDDPELLHPSSIWYFQSKRYESVARTTAHIAMCRGQGLPGRVWAKGKPQFISDISTKSDFPRKKIMLDVGIHAAFGFPIYANGRLQAVVEFFLSARQPPDNRLLRTIENIGDQLGRVLERQCAEEQEVALRQALDSLTTSVFFTDSLGKVLRMNKASEQLIASTRALKISNDNVLVPTDRGSAAKFARAIGSATSSEPATLDGPFIIAPPDEDAAGLVATIFPLEKSKLADLCGAPKASLAVFVQDPEAKTPNAASAIAELYGLTRSELRLVEILSPDGSIKQMAKSLGVSETTVKTHLQHIFSKTGTHKRSELIQLLASIAPPVRSS